MSQYICGKNSVIDAVKQKLSIKVIYISSNFNIPTNDIKIIKKTSQELDKMVKTKHQGIVAVLNEFDYYSIDEIIKDKPDKVLVLDHIQDPHNLGAILRSANVFGVKHIIIPKDRATKVTPTVLKVASGGQVGIKIIRVDSLLPSMSKLKDNGFWIYATVLNDDVTSLKQTIFNYPLALIMGNEQKGVNKSLLKISDQRVYIDMEGTVQSLNVSVATGIMLFNI